MKVTYYSHSSFGIYCNKFHILIDPFFSNNPLKNIHYDLFNQCLYDIKFDYILVTHAHDDHIHDVGIIAERTNALVISNYEICNYLACNYKIKTLGINFGSFINTDFGKIRYTWAQHSSSFDNNFYGGNPGGFLLYIYDKYIYISGDTALTQEMKLIPFLIDSRLDVAILPIGGLYTMDYHEVLIASDFIKCDNILPCHYNTYSNIKVDIKHIETVFNNQNKIIHFLNVGESIHI
jgi:L-ascorbate metabolism protein UlaG (beta-lactamase superfamily)